MTRTTGTIERIRQLIAANGLCPSDCLPSESDLCDSLGVSRSLPREAVRTLSTPEVIGIQHGRGALAGSATLRPLVETLVFRMNMLPGKHQHVLLEMVEVRRGIDLGEAEQVCSMFRGTGDEELYWLVDRITETMREGKSFAELDRGFHVTLMSRAGRRIIANLVAAYWDIQTMTLAKLLLGTVTNLLGAYTEILGVTEAGDIDNYR